MDDDRTQKTLDALADLFLTGTAPAPRPVPARSQRVVPAPSRSTATAKADVLDQLDAPAPIRMPGSVRLSPTLRPPAAATAAAPAPLRIAGDRPLPASAPPPPAMDVRVEAVFMGNLPGFGGPWLTQYAHFLARQRGPVAVLHADEQHVEIELITAGPVSADEQAAAAPPTEGEDLIDALGELAWDTQTPARTFLVHLSPPVTDADRAAAMGFDRWTLLCGADDTAAVGALRLLKQALGTDDDTQAEPSDRRVGVMVMGSDEARGRAVANKLTAAAAGLLTTPLELVGWQKQMTPVNLRRVGVFDATEDVWSHVREFFDELASGTIEPVCVPAQPAPEATSRTEAAPDPMEAFVVADESTAQRTEPAASPRPVINRDTVYAAMARAQAAAPKPQADKSTPHAGPFRPGSGPEGPGVASISEPDLVSFLGPAIGGVALQARCPRQPATQLVLDESGRLHLLRRHTSGVSGSGGDAELRAAVLDLIDARAWVREHLDLLQLTQRQLRFDPAAEPVLHLFTDQAKTAIALASRLGEFLKLHLLQQVRIGPDAAWFSTELN